jgi:HAD superfamily hydrolase (TIGR01493 family)
MAEALSPQEATKSSPLQQALASIDLVTFDVFGTLVDWQKALPALGVGLEKMPVFLRESERQQRPQKRDAQFVEYRSLLEHVGSVLRPDLPIDQVRRWARGFGELPFFSDTVASIKLLGAVVDVGVISNCDAVHQLDVARRIGRAWDVCAVAEELEAYKPTDRAWDRAVQFVERRGYDKQRWLHVSAWDDYDLAPAAARGIRTAYVPRPGGVAPQQVDARFDDLLHLARSVAAAKQGPVLYEVAARASSAEVFARYVRWMEDEHLAQVRACLGVRSAELVRVDALHARSIYRFTSRAAYQRYIEKDAPKLRARGRELFQESEIAFERSESTILHAV